MLGFSSFAKALTHNSHPNQNEGMKRRNKNKIPAIEFHTPAITNKSKLSIVKSMTAIIAVILLGILVDGGKEWKMVEGKNGENRKQINHFHEIYYKISHIVSHYRILAHNFRCHAYCRCVSGPGSFVCVCVSVLVCHCPT